MTKEMPLGRTTPTPEKYDPALLYPISRGEAQPGMHGFDLWRAYELSWIGPYGTPETAVLQVVYPLQSKNIVESKSLKLYINGMAGTCFAGRKDVVETIRRDLAGILDSPWIDVSLLTDRTGSYQGWTNELPGSCIDGMDIGGIPDKPDPSVLRVLERRTTSEALFSHLFRSYCPITRQPDWASVLIEYRGGAIDRTALLRYLCSYRSYEGFSEQCCEEIYRDILAACAPERLTVSCFYTRRGGIDINPVRSTVERNPEETGIYRLLRQ